MNSVLNLSEHITVYICPDLYTMTILPIAAFSCQSHICVRNTLREHKLFQPRPVLKEMTFTDTNLQRFQHVLKSLGVTGNLHAQNVENQNSLIFHSDLKGEENVGAFCLLGVLKIRLFFYFFFFHDDISKT